ncbi:angiotensin-converting enzyme-like isoform X2 [Bacillus rossius redtenbacheri]|uniref:angiotensin-converting enzyme-like isoform X2 n=1 Tax=Bacillus rossius redtenbacheri TaxID=93214 RepID=UPI002FDE04CA
MTACRGHAAHLVLLYSVVLIRAQSAYYEPRYVEGANTNVAEAEQFLDDYEREATDKCFRVKQAQWLFSTNVTDFHRRHMLEQQGLQDKLERASWRRAASFGWTRFSDPELRRKLRALVSRGRHALPDQEHGQLQRIVAEMKDIYSRARICPYRGRETSTYCNMPLEPDAVQLLARSRDYEEQLHLWRAWRDAVGPALRGRYARYVRLANRAAKLDGFRDAGQQERQQYEEDDLEAEAGRLWQAVAPLYEQLHSYVRRRLAERYGTQRVRPDGPIPAHLLGNMWAQNWKNIADLVLPFPGKPPVDARLELLRQRFTPLRMFQVAEEFFTSLGMKPMPIEFWQYSMLEKPLDREVKCKASAWDFCNRIDYRIKQCTQLTLEDLLSTHHEMAHIQYYLQYAGQPLLFRDGANPGFHEAVGDAVGLSVATPRHLQAIGVLANFTDDYETNINFLLMMALEKVAYLPYAYIVDKWRWAVFSDEHQLDRMNAVWWDLRLRFQGLAPPVPRSERDFDPAAKYHVPADVPYFRYFVSLILQFQLHEALCREAGHYGPLHACDIYRSRQAGRLLRPWTEAVHVLTQGRTHRLDAGALLHYFQPLATWLQEQNRREASVGWSVSDADIGTPRRAGLTIHLHVPCGASPGARPAPPLILALLALWPLYPLRTLKEVKVVCEN